VTPSDRSIENATISEYDRSDPRRRDVRAVKRRDDARHFPPFAAPRIWRARYAAVA
jgi:hypothetical protein